MKLNKEKVFYPDRIFVAQYRPFSKQWVYFHSDLNECSYKMSHIFPTTEHKNMCIVISGTGERKGFASLMVNIVSDLNMYDGGSQCFPLYYYEEDVGNLGTLFEQGQKHYIRRDSITDFILNQCRERYGHKVVKEDIFYYVYGLLHSPDYRSRFSADLKKMLPRIPLVDIPNDFWAFSKAGRELADLHVNYETAPAYPSVQVIGAESGNFRVEKLSFAKQDGKEDKTTLVYNSSIKITNIPLEAYNYVVNGRSAIEWIIDRYQVKIDKASGIKNDPNDWGLEHNNPRYILDLILSVITVSVQTQEIINKLPKLDFK